MNQVISTGWTVSKAQQLFDMQADNEDATIVDMENKVSEHWVARWKFLVEHGCPRVIAYDTVAARARKSRKTIQNYVRAYEYFGDAVEEYMPAGITYLTAAITRKHPEAFLDEAMKSTNTTIDTLLAEFEPNEGEVGEEFISPPYPSYGWGIGRRLAILPTADRSLVERHLSEIVTIFRRNGVE
jgi:hypothetical protein